MVASLISDFALLVTAIAIVIFASGMVVGLLKGKGSKATVTHGATSISFEAAQTELAHIHSKIAEISIEVEAVGKAVNNVPEGTPTLVHRVGTLEQKVDELTKVNTWMIDALVLIGTNVGVILIRPERKAYEDGTGNEAQ